MYDPYLAQSFIIHNRPLKGLAEGIARMGLSHAQAGLGELRLAVERQYSSGRRRMRSDNSFEVHAITSKPAYRP